MHTKGVSVLIINASAVQMNAQRAYSKTEKKTVSSKLSLGTSSSKKKASSTTAASSNISEQGKALAAQKKQLLKGLEEDAEQKKNNAMAAQSTGGIDFREAEEQATTQMIKKMMEMLNRMRQRIMDGRYSNQQFIDIRTRSRLMSLPSITTTWTQETTTSSFVAESEAVSFSTTGIAKTADGREINFNVNMELSREFMEQTQMTELSQVKRVMTDPLVINLNTASATVSDQKFRFDLNADGVEDDISYLNSGSGFLALDKNGDGKINDGNELFGAKTGNGFSELAAYDSDGNGWIDEADAIYDKLVVWVKTADGTDKMLSLKEANVGAIYLGSVSTDYSLTGSTADNANAQIRRTGVFLKETTGQAGTIQHVDFAI